VTVGILVRGRKGVALVVVALAVVPTATGPRKICAELEKASLTLIRGGPNGVGAARCVVGAHTLFTGSLTVAAHLAAAAAVTGERRPLALNARRRGRFAVGHYFVWRASRTGHATALGGSFERLTGAEGRGGGEEGALSHRRPCDDIRLLCVCGTPLYTRSAERPFVAKVRAHTPLHCS